MGVTPHALSVLILIKEALGNKTVSRVLLPVLFKLVSNKTHDTLLEPTLPALGVRLQAELSGVQGGQLFERVVAVLSGLCEEEEGPDAILDFFEEVELLVSPFPAPLSKASVLGLYVRSMVLSFNQLTFSSVAGLLEALVKYRHTEQATFAQTVSKPELQAYLHQRAVTSQAALGRVSFEEVDGWLDRLPSRHLSQTHFLRYLNCLHHREFEDALDSLHRYFDYLAPEMQAGKDQSRPPATHQYAILNLAILHLGFGHFDLCVQSIQEAVRIAQQNADHTCLMHCLSLLGRVAQDQGSNGDGGSQEATQLLERCVLTQVHAASKAKKDREAWAAQQALPRPEGQAPPAAPDPPPAVPTVEAQGWLALARLQLEHLEGSAGQADPGAVWSSLQKASEVTMAHGLDDLAGTQLLLRAGAWQQYGSSALSRTCLETQLKYFGSSGSSEGPCLALAGLAANPTTPAKMAEELLLYARRHWPHKSHNGLQELTLQTEFNQALAAGHVERASRLARQIFALAPAKGKKWQFFVEARFAEAQLLAVHGRSLEAVRLAMELARMCESKGDFVTCVKYLLFVAQIHQEADDELAVLPCVLRALSLCRKLNLDSLGAEASVALAKVQLALQRPEQALLAMYRVYPQVLEHGGPRATAEAHIVIARGLVSCAAGCGEDEGAGRRSLEDAVAFLVQAKGLCDEGHFARELRDCTYLLARCYDRLGRTKERNTAAVAYNRAAQITG
jgi:hypothetical protein